MSQLTPIPGGIVAADSTTAAAHLLGALAERGVRAAFGIPGGAVAPVFDALAEVSEIELVSTRHETTAVFAALGHARATGVPAIVMVTAGPGVANTLSGICTASLEEIPLIVLGGEVATSSFGRGAFQDGSHAGLDVVGLMRNVTRFCTTVVAPSMMAGAAERAWLAATGPRPGPVFLSIPYDVGYAPAARPIFATSQPVHPAAAEVSACRTARDLLVGAKRPLMILGAGARHASSEAVDLAERLAIPVIATAHAKGVFPEEHPLYVGLMGNAGHPSAHAYLASGPDVVLVVGSRLGDFATNGWRLPVTGRVATIQVDRDPLLIGRNASVTLGIVADAAVTLRTVASLVAANDTYAPRDPHPTLERRAWPLRAAIGLVKPQHAVTAVASAFPTAIYCSDIGEHMGFAQHYTSVGSPDRFHCMSAYGSMGSGIGAAIGIQRAKRESTVVCFAGDGGFNMHASELLTCVEQRIGVVFAVLNDGCWSMVEHGFRAVFSRKPEHLAHRVANLAAVARGYGADAAIIDRPALLEPSHLQSLRRRGVPLLLDIRIDREESLSASTRSAGFRR